MIIFNFHHVEPQLTHPDRMMITITPEGLTNVIRTFRALGFTFVSMDEVLAAGGPEQMLPRSVLITFDDGFENNYLFAAPVLEAEKCPATIFVLPGRFGGTNEWDQADLPAYQRDRLMSLAQMQQLAKENPYVSFGSHGLYHQHLPQLDELSLHREIYHSHEILSDQLGSAYKPVFAYPWGEYDQTVLEMMKKSPYKYGFTTEKSRWDGDEHLYAIPRFSGYWRDSNPVVLFGKLFRHNILLG